MSSKRVLKAAAAIAAGSILFAATAANATPLVTGVTIAGSGSSFAYNGIQKCDSLYASNNVSYTSTGSGTGRSNFMNNSDSYAFAVSDGLYTAGTEPNNPLSGSGYTMAALFGGPIVFAYGKGIPSGLKLNAAIVSGILKGTITKWGNTAIKKANGQITSKTTWKKLASKSIHVYYRNTNSGTNENLTNYLSQVVPTAGWTKNQAINSAVSGGVVGTGAATSAIVADKVEADSYGFGYFDLSDAKTAKVRIAKLRNQQGHYIAPTGAAGALFLNSQAISTTGSSRTDGTMTIDFTKKVKNAYQLTIVTYGVAPKSSSDDKAKAVEDYFKFVVNTCMPAQASRLGYIALTGSLKTNALAQIAGISN